MSKKANTAMIGAFVIGAIVLAVVGILTFGSGVLFKDTDEFVLFFEGDLKGLSVGAPVLFRGVPVGQVLDIRVYYARQGEEFLIPVTIETDSQRFHDLDTVSEDLDDGKTTQEDLDRLIQHGLRAQLTLQSIVTGQLAVQLDMLPNAPVRLRGDGRMLEIPTVPSSIERLASALEKLNLGQLVDNINQAMQALEGLLADEGLENLVNDFQKAAEEVAHLAHEINGRSELLTAEVQKTAEEARGMMQSVESKIDPLAGKALAAMDQMTQTLERAEASLAAIDRLAADYAGDSAFRFELAAALEEIALTARSVRALTDMLEQQPDVLLRGKTAPEGNR